ncbi:unnamed protein product [Ambrosiozyma monospora]|uniref:Unnamed protein product n=1 Tax=Ambrosiozyma monospora TaxID=43982 RepID=A0ACB5U9R5_AMBMO|nr:unnamed protein product [Ambrosiozyma monospora]
MNSARDKFFEKLIDEFEITIDVAKRIQTFNDEVSRYISIRTTCAFVDQGECIIQGNGITCSGYYACFEIDPCVQSGEMVRFDKEILEMALGAFEQQSLLADIGIDGSSLKDEQLGFSNGEVWITDLESLDHFPIFI